MAGVQAGRLNIEIVAEIARLQQDLDKAKRAVGAASKEIARDARAANDNLAGMGRGALRAGQNSRLASHHMANLSFQLQDIVVGLTSGQKPMTVFLQQGSQIGQIMGQAGLGIGGLTKSVSGMVVGFARAHPILVALGVAAGGATVGIRSLTGEMTDSGKIDQFVAGLGLTKDELEKLEGQAVTAGDVFKGLWKTLLDVTTLDEKIGAFWQRLKEFASDAGTAILTVIKNTAAGIYAGFKGSLEAARILYHQLPRAIGEGVINAANFVIRTLEQMANGAIGILNKVIGGVNNTFVGKLFGELPQLAQVSFGRIENSLAGSASRMGSDLRGVFSEAFNEGLAGMDSFMSSARENILQATRDRLSAAAAEIIADRDGKAGRGGTDRVAKAKKEIDEFAKSVKAAMDASRDFRDGMVREVMQAELTEIQLRRLEGATHALALEKLALIAPTEEVRQALLAEADAVQRDLDKWEEWYRGRANKAFDQDILQPLRDEIALHDLAGTARERAALLLQKEGLMAEWAAKGMTDLNDKWAAYLSLNERLWAQQDAMAAWQERYGRVSDFLGDVNKTPEQMAAAWDDVKMNGLDAFNEGLVDAIVNFRSLGDVAQQIIRQILSDLLRLQIQQAIIGPLANMLGLSTGAPVNLLAGTPFGGGAASGRDFVSPGTAYTVGERGRETFIPAVPGQIVPNGANDNARPISLTVNFTGTGDAKRDRASADQVGRRIKRQINGLG
jgi:hypothetical protein